MLLDFLMISSRGCEHTVLSSNILVQSAVYNAKEKNRGYEEISVDENLLNNMFAS